MKDIATRFGPATTVIMGDVYVKNNIVRIFIFLTSYGWPSDVSSYVSGIGYSLNTLYNGSCTSIENSMPSKAVFIWSGHGAAGEMRTTDNNFFNIYAQNSTYNLAHDLWSGSLSNEIVWFQGCSEANTDPSYGNFFSTALSKSTSGTRFLGVNEDYGWSTGKQWNFLTWQYAYNQQTSIINTIWQAANDAGTGSIYPFNSTNVVEYSN